MQNIHIAKINDIPVLQFGESTLKVQNKKAQKADVNKGINKNLDLGQGVKTLTITIKVIDANTFEAISRILSNDRECTITDKFLGTVKVSIDSYDIKNSDKYLGVSKISLKLTITEKFTPFINYTGHINTIINNLANDIQPNFLGGIIEGDEVYKDFKTHFDNFIFDISSMQFDTSFVSQFYNILALIRSDLTLFAKSFNKSQKPLFTVPTALFRQLQELNEINRLKSSIKIIKNHNKNLTTRTINTLYLMIELRMLTEVTTHTDLVLLSNRIFKRLELIKNIQDLGLVNDNNLNLIDTTNILDTTAKYANNTQLKTTKQITIKNEKTLFNIVNEIYGNLDNFNDILELNRVEHPNINKIKGLLWIYM